MLYSGTIQGRVITLDVEPAMPVGGAVLVYVTLSPGSRDVGPDRSSLLKAVQSLRGRYRHHHAASGVFAAEKLDDALNLER